MSASTGTLQVVPDIDEQAEKEQKVSPFKSTPSSTMSDFEMKLTQSITSTTGQKIGQKLPIQTRRRPHTTLQPPIRRLNSDARPLSPAEMIAHRRLLQQQPTRTQSPQRTRSPLVMQRQDL